MPKLWTATVDAHRRDVRDAILDQTAGLVGEHGLLSVTMSKIAEETGIGRATLYKYFTDVEAILTAWHERQIARHLDQLVEIREGPGDPSERLQSVLEAYAEIAQRRRGHSDHALAAVLHRDHHRDRKPGHHPLQQLIRDLLAEGAKTGHVRRDVPPDELATYCIHSIEAAGVLTSKPAVQRLVQVTLAGLRPQR